MTKQEEKEKPDRFDRISKLIVPIVGGLLVALAAAVGNNIVANYTSRQENARLISELQIQREQAESDLRKDMFQQAVGALLSEDELRSKQLSISKRMLKLDLLAQNFGGTLSITPLFTEFDRDLEQQERTAGNDLDKEVHVRALRSRLRSIARRLSRDQLSALALRGALAEIKVYLKPGGKEFAGIGAGPEGSENEESATYSRNYNWPEDEVRSTMGEPVLWGSQYDKVFNEEEFKRGVVKLNGIERHVSVTLGHLDPERRAVSITLDLCWNKNGKQKFECEEKGDESVHRTFTLDFFNFPKVDNTRLSDNQRFSTVLEQFDPGGDTQGLLEIAAVIFPAEYSSFRDRPSMQESVDLLNSVLHSQDSSSQQETKNDETLQN